VGTFAIQLARHVGATVATATSTANADLVKSLGADVVVDYKKEDFAHVLHDYDVVLNSLDKVTLEQSLAVLQPRGPLDLRPTRIQDVLPRDSRTSLLVSGGTSSRSSATSCSNNARQRDRSSVL
jgi:D-arabinose 1-dehydrogenase-like Zn-dependent alcohol dehydrogenase